MFCSLKHSNKLSFKIRFHTLIYIDLKIKSEEFSLFSIDVVIIYEPITSQENKT
jgi:hypothetical protein